MTATTSTLGAPSGANLTLEDPGRGESGTGKRWREPSLVVAFLIGIATAVLRLYRLNVSYDVYVDEVTYLRIGQSVDRGHGVVLYGKPFFLHPPWFFFVEALFLRLVHVSGNVLSAVATLRVLNVALAALTAMMLMLLVRSVAGRVPALVGGIAFAIDPFIIRQNSRVLLETNALFWVMAGYVVLLPLTKSTPPQRRSADGRAVAGGLLFGVAVLSNDVNAFLTVLPLGVCFLLRWGLTRRQTLTAAACCCLAYLPYPVVVLLTGNWSAFATEKAKGFLRLTGSVQTTGFNRPAAVPLTTKLMQNIGQFGPTYAIIGVGVAACGVLVLSKSAPHRFLAAWAGSAFVFLAYSVAIGTIEEQMFYYLVLPNLVVTVIAGDWLWRRRGTVRVHRLIAAIICCAALLWAGTSAYTYEQVHTTSDNGYDRLLTYLDHNVPRRASIAISATTSTGSFVLDRFSAQQWNTVDQIVRYRAQYVVVSTKAIKEGYSYAAPDLLPWLKGHAAVIFSYHGTSVGDLILYRIDPAATCVGCVGPSGVPTA